MYTFSVHKYKVFIAAGVVLAVLVLGGVAIVEASTISTFNLIGNANFKFHLIDMTNDTNNATITLPTTVGNNGQVRVGKRINGQNGIAADLVPAAGDTIDNGAVSALGLGGSGDYVIMVADEANRTWWVISKGVGL